MRSPASCSVRPGGAPAGEGSARPGFTLFEAVVSLMVIGMIAVGALASVGTQLRTATHVRDVTEAELLAADRLALVRLMGATELQALPDSVAKGNFPPPFGRYAWRVTSTPVLDEEDLNDVTIRVVWPEGAYTLWTRLYSRPPADSSATGGGFGSG